MQAQTARMEICLRGVILSSRQNCIESPKLTNAWHSSRNDPRHTRFMRHKSVCRETSIRIS